MKNVACIIARTQSTRLPRKALIDINGLKMIEYIIKKIKRSKLIDVIYLCTSTQDDDKALLKIAKDNGIKAYAGSINSVIERMLDVAKIEHADNLIRITGDNIFTDEVYIDIMLKYHQANNVDYTRTEYLPVGVTAEIISCKALEKCNSLMDSNYSEYLFLYIFQPLIFKCQILIPDKSHHHPDWLLTIDTPKDLKRIKNIIQKKTEPMNYAEIIERCENLMIPDLEIQYADNIKFPGGIYLSYEAFAKEKEHRMSQSNQIVVDINEYDNSLITMLDD